MAILIKAAIKHDGMNNFLRQDLIDEIRMRLRELGSDGGLTYTSAQTFFKYANFARIV